MSLSLSIFTKLVSERPIGRRAVGGSCLRGNLARLATGRDERSCTRVKGSPVSLEPGDDGLYVVLRSIQYWLLGLAFFSGIHNTYTVMHNAKLAFSLCYLFCR